MLRVIAGTGAGLSGALLLLWLVVRLVLIGLVAFIFPFRLFRRGLIRRAVDRFDLVLFECFPELGIFVFELLYLRLRLGDFVSQAQNNVDELFLC